MNDLLSKKCVPCEGGIPPLTHEEIFKFMEQVSGWNVIEDEGPNVKRLGVGAKISKEFKLKNFVEAMDFVKKVADLAEAEGHHPDIHIKYNKVLFELSTHAIGGLSENDFILAAKIDALK